MRIIKEGKKPSTETTITCKNCETIFAYKPEDINPDPRDGTYVICPVCDACINHK